MKKVSLVVPAFNEQDNIDNFVISIDKLWREALSKNFDYEILFVDDGSSDKTASKIIDCAKKNKYVKLVKLTRNFGKEAAVTAGFKFASGDAVIIVDADLQYPIDKIPEFISKWQKGSLHVVGLRDKKNTNDTIEKLGSRLFNKVINFLAEQKFDSRALDFRLLDRQVVDDFNKLGEKQRMVRGLLDWLGYQPDFVEYTEQNRNAGVSNFSFRKRVRLAINTIINHSTLPLKLIAMLGFVITLLSLFVGAFILFDLISNRHLFGFSGSFIFANINLFLNGLVLICLGLVGFYIGAIKNEVIDRPLFVVEKFYK